MKGAMIVKTENGYIIVKGDFDFEGTLPPKLQGIDVSESLNKMFDFLCLYFEAPKTEETKQP